MKEHSKTEFLKGDFDYLHKWQYGKSIASPNSPIGQIGPGIRGGTLGSSDNILFEEMQLLVLGDVVPLNYYISEQNFLNQIEQYKDKWTDLPGKLQVPRKALLLTGLKTDTYTDNGTHLNHKAQEINDYGLSELEFKYPTKLYNDLICLTSLMDYFSPLGRSFLLKLDAGGGFPPHRDYPEIPREVFSIFLFFGKPVKWFINNKKVDIELGRLYYINTRKLHETVCNEDSSFHVCLRVPQTMENIYKLMNML
tara:strand:+ start:1428 stop:2183 length:756 start_codon:yes stop_codon:yes gene_type:complete